MRGDTPVFVLGTNQTVSISGTSARTATAVADGVSLVRLVSTTDVHVKIGPGSPTATTSDPLLPAYTVEYFAVMAGQKIAGIQASASGTLHVTECTK